MELATDAATVESREIENRIVPRSITSWVWGRKKTVRTRGTGEGKKPDGGRCPVGIESGRAGRVRVLNTYSVPRYHIALHYLVPGFQIGIWSPASNLHRGERAPEPSESRRTPGFPPLVVFLSLQFLFFFSFSRPGVVGVATVSVFFSFFRPGSWGSWLVAFYNRIQRLANLFDLVPLSAR